jgi:hypothetical protein
MLDTGPDKARGLSMADGPTEGLLIKYRCAYTHSRGDNHRHLTL